MKITKRNLLTYAAAITLLCSGTACSQMHDAEYGSHVYNDYKSPTTTVHTAHKANMPQTQGTAVAISGDNLWYWN